MSEGRGESVDAPTLVIDGDEGWQLGVEAMEVAGERPHGRGIAGVLAEERDAGKRDVRVEPARVAIERRTGEASQEESRDGAPERWHRQPLPALPYSLK
jgi:hypothetical protein